MIKFVRLVALAFFSAFFIPSVLAQDLESKNDPAYIQRNRDFQDRRIGEGYVNFAEQYMQAYRQLRVPSGALNKSEDEWTPRGPFGKEVLAGTGRVNSIQFHPTDTNTWYICVAQGGVWKTTNAGESWTPVSGDLPILRTSYLAIHPNNPDIMYIALGDYAYLGHNLQANESKRNSHYGIGIYKTVDGGDHWTPTGLSFSQEDFEGSLIAKVLINPSNSNHLIAVGQSGSYISTDSGDNWTQTSNKLFWDLEQDPTQNNVLYASTGYVHSYGIGEVSILKSTDFGATWTTSSTNIPATGVVQRIELAVAPSDPNYIYAIACDTIGGFYGFYRSTDAGASFFQRTGKNYTYNILGWYFDNSPGGQGRYDLAICVDRKDRDKVLIGGVNMWQTADGGSSFEPVTYWALNYQGLSLHADIHQIVQHPVNQSYFACHDGGISRTYEVIPDDPADLQQFIVSTQWEHYTDGLNITSFYRLSVNQVNPVELLAGAQDNSTVYTDGDQFFNISGGDGMEALFQDHAFYRYTSSQNGRIYAFLSFGGSFDYEGVFGPPSNELAEWTTPFVQGKSNIYVLYGNLYSAIGENLMSKHSNMPKIPNKLYPKPGTALAVDRTNEKVMYAAKRGYVSQGLTNEIWSTQSGGGTWIDISGGLPRYAYPSYIEMDQEAPERVWITFSGFDSANKVFFSSDYGQDWTNITYDLPNVPVNCITYQNDGSGIVYIGTDIGVFYLHKDSTSWIYFSNGLPKVIVSELEIDTTNKTLVAATFGRGMWEVGLVPNMDTTISVNEIVSEEYILVLAPNPVSDHLTISTPGSTNDILSLRVVDVTGRLIKEVQWDTSKTENFELQVSDLLTGEYFVIINGRHGRVGKRFLKI